MRCYFGYSKDCRPRWFNHITVNGKCNTELVRRSQLAKLKLWLLTLERISFLNAHAHWLYQPKIHAFFTQCEQFENSIYGSVYVRCYCHFKISYLNVVKQFFEIMVFPIQVDRSWCCMPEIAARRRCKSVELIFFERDFGYSYNHISLTLLNI